MRPLRTSTFSCLAIFATLVVPSLANAEPAVDLSFDGANYQLEQFDTDTPGTTASTLTITGVTAGYDLAAMDLRPETGELYVLAVDDLGGTATDTAIQLYVLARPAAVGTTITAVPLGAPVTGLPDATRWGLDFNPTVDRARVTSDAGYNTRLNPITGAVSGVDTALSVPAAGAAVAYDRSVRSTTLSSLYSINAASDILGRIGGPDGTPSPNGGAVSTIGALGADVSPKVSFDIAPTSGEAFVLDANTLYTANLASGALTRVGNRAGGDLVGLTVLPSSSVRLDASAVTVGERAGSVSITVARSGDTSRAGSVKLDTAAGTATAGSDFTTTSSTVSFAAGDTLARVSIPVVDDALVEGDEAFTVTLSGATGAAELASPTSATVTITSDDVADKSAPIVLLQTLTATSYAKLAKFGEAVRWSCSEACTTTLTLKLGTTTIGTGRKVLSAPGVTSIGIKVTPRGKVLLAKRLRLAPLRRQALSLTLVSTDAAGNKRVTRGAFVVRR